MIGPQQNRDIDSKLFHRPRHAVPGCCCRGLDNQELRNKHIKRLQALAPHSEGLNLHSCVYRLQLVCETMVQILQTGITVFEYGARCSTQQLVAYNKQEVCHFLICFFIQTP